MTTRSLPLAAAAAALIAGIVAACSRPLPEEGSPDAALYALRCGTGCHKAYDPRTLTPKMWQLQFDRMDAKYRAVGQWPPEGEERARLLAYIMRNAAR